MNQIKFKNIPQNLLATFLIEWLNNTSNYDDIGKSKNLIKILINIKNLKPIKYRIKSTFICKESDILMISKIFPSTYYLQILELDCEGQLCFLELMSLKTIDFFQVEDDDIKNINFVNFKLLTKLNFSGSGITDESMKCLSILESLKKLDLSECQEITDEGIKNLVLPGKLKLLKWLDCYKCGGISDDGLKYISENLPSLNFLNVDSSVDITDKGLKYLSKLKFLTNVNFSDCINITNKGLKYFRLYKTLTKIDISGCCEITKHGLKYLSELQLVYLNIKYCTNITNTSIEHFLQKTKSLKILDIYVYDEIILKNIKNLSIKYNVDINCYFI